jgi:hypothetical protein
MQRLWTQCNLVVFRLSALEVRRWWWHRRLGLIFRTLGSDRARACWRQGEANALALASVLHAAMVDGDLRGTTVSGCWCQWLAGPRVKKRAVIARDRTSKHLLSAKLKHLCLASIVFVEQKLWGSGDAVVSALSCRRCWRMWKSRCLLERSSCTL